MAVPRIILWLGKSLLCCAFLFLLTALIGFSFAEREAAVLLSGLTLFLGIFGAILVVLTYNAPKQESNFEALLFLTLFWLLIPLVTALPFIMLMPELSLLEAYFESVSAITTTGATRLDPDNLSKSLVFWRSALQGFGGVSTATLAVVILAALNLTGTGIHRSALFTLKRGELFEHMLEIGRFVALIYISFAMIAALLMVMNDVSPFWAICLSLSGVSTGGLMPFDGPVSLFIGPVPALILAILCITGAMNIALLWDFIRSQNAQKFKRLFFNIEHRTLWVIISLLTMLAAIYSGAGNVFAGLLDSVFFVTTAGFQYSVFGLNVVPSVVLVSFALIGGSALSTAGGLKVMRFLLLFRHLITDLRRLSHPSRIIPVKLRSQKIDDSAFLSVWMYFFAYAMIFGLGVAAFGFSGLGLEDAIISSSANLTNMGPLLTITLPESGLTYFDFTPAQLKLSALLMLLGRMEVLALLALFLPEHWQR